MCGAGILPGQMFAHWKVLDFLWGPIRGQTDAPGPWDTWGVPAELFSVRLAGIMERTTPFPLYSRCLAAGAACSRGTATSMKKDWLVLGKSCLLDTM